MNIQLISCHISVSVTVNSIVNNTHLLNCVIADGDSRALRRMPASRLLISSLLERLESSP